MSSWSYLRPGCGSEKEHEEDAGGGDGSEDGAQRYPRVLLPVRGLKQGGTTSLVTSHKQPKW